MQVFVDSAQESWLMRDFRKTEWLDRSDMYIRLDGEAWAQTVGRDNKRAMSYYLMQVAYYLAKARGQRSQPWEEGL